MSFKLKQLALKVILPEILTATPEATHKG
jgi:hypothetical protein